MIVLNAPGRCQPSRHKWHVSHPQYHRGLVSRTKRKGGRERDSELPASQIFSHYIFAYMMFAQGIDHSCL